MYDDNVFRRVEEEVLDKLHRQFALLCRNETTAVEALLRRYARILRDLRTGKIAKPSDDAKSETANEGLRGLGHCLRWIRKCCPTSLHVPTPEPNQLANEALDLLRWGVTYDVLWNQHSACSRGLVVADVDEQNKTITFLPQRDVNPQFFCTQIEAKKADDERLARACPDSRLAALSKAWCDSVASTGQKMSFDDVTIRTSGAIDVASAWMEKTCLPELADATVLLGCTVGELRRVLAALFVYSLFVTKLEDVADDQPGLGVALQPCVVARQPGDMVEWLADLSGVSATSVKSILSVATFDPSHAHVTLAQQPFVSTRDGRIFFLPRMALFLDLPRMYVGALNKDETGKAVYDGTINMIEAAGVESMVQDIRAAVPQVLQIAEKRKFRLPDGQEIEPDIVVASNGDGSVLVIDVKYATPPFGPGDVHRDVEEMKKWKTRMSEYVSAFRNNPHILAQHFQWTSQQSATVFGLILPRWPLPIPVDFPESICAVDWPSLREHLQQTQPESISDLMIWARCRPDVNVPKTLAWTAKKVEIGEWTYEYSVLTPTGDHPSIASGESSPG